jgi:hypothetical protein
METKIEQYLIDLMYTYRELGPHFWLLEDPEHNLEEVAVAYSDPLVIIRMQIMDAPKTRREEFFAKLLELNAGDLVHGAYGLEGNKVVLIDTMEYDTMDYTEFRATLDAFSLALTQHYPIFAAYRNEEVS